MTEETENPKCTKCGKPMRMTRQVWTIPGPATIALPPGLTVDPEKLKAEDNPKKEYRCDECNPEIW